MIGYYNNFEYCTSLLQISFYLKHSLDIVLLSLCVSFDGPVKRILVKLLFTNCLGFRLIPSHCITSIFGYV